MGHSWYLYEVKMLHLFFYYVVSINSSTLEPSCLPSGSVVGAEVCLFILIIHVKWLKTLRSCQAVAFFETVVKLFQV